MAKFRIKFSSDKILPDNTLIEDEYVRQAHKLIALKKANNENNINEDAIFDLIRKNDLLSKRGGEKGILQACLSYAMTNAKLPADFAIISCMSAEIRDADECWDVDERDWKTYIVDSLEGSAKKATPDGKSQRENWIHYSEFWSQVNRPEQISESNKE